MDRGSRDTDPAAVRCRPRPALCGRHSCRRRQVQDGGLVSGLRTALLQRKELVAQIDEGHSVALAAKFEVEQPTIEGQRRFDITHLESGMIKTNGARLFASDMGLQ
jgi:hypothetical protein